MGKDPALRFAYIQNHATAVEGDAIYVGGGFTSGDELFIVCGYVSSEPP